MLNSFSFQRRSSYTANFTKPICQSPFNIIFYFQTELKITACICPTGIVQLASMEVINMNYIQHHVFSTDGDSYVRKLKVFVTIVTLIDSEGCVAIKLTMTLMFSLSIIFFVICTTFSKVSWLQVRWWSPAEGYHWRICLQNCLCKILSSRRIQHQNQRVPTSLSTNSMQTRESHLWVQVVDSLQKTPLWYFSV